MLLRNFTKEVGREHSSRLEYLKNKSALWLYNAPEFMKNIYRICEIGKSRHTQDEVYAGIINWQGRNVRLNWYESFCVHCFC